MIRRNFNALVKAAAAVVLSTGIGAGCTVFPDGTVYVPPPEVYYRPPAWASPPRPYLFGGGVWIEGGRWHDHRPHRDWNRVERREFRGAPPPRNAPPPVYRGGDHRGNNPPPPRPR